MYTTALIRRHISRLQLGRLFTTRDLLSYGRRAAVDKALCRLVRMGLIIRLARGVFMREGSQIPSWFEIARAKAEAFGKKIMRHCADIAVELGLVTKGNPLPTFGVAGRSSSFRAGDTVIHLKAISPRKMQLGESRAGQAARAMWHLGSGNFMRQHATIAAGDLLRGDRNELRRSAFWMPAWLSCYFITPRSWAPML